MSTHPYHAMQAAAIGRVQIARDEQANRQIITEADAAVPWCECGRGYKYDVTGMCAFCHDEKLQAEREQKRRVFGEDA